MRAALVCLLLLSTFSVGQSAPDSLPKLASDFWTWRAKYRPFTFDDVPRMEHAGGARDWSAAAIARQRVELTEFEHRWNGLPSANWSVAQKIDYRLIGSAIARVRWELDVNPRWQRDPVFYVEQTVVALQEELMPPPPFSDTRSREIVTRLENIPSILEQAKGNLKPVAAFAQLAISSLSDIEVRMSRVENGVTPSLSSSDNRSRFHAAMPKASKALADYRQWLQANLSHMNQNFSVGEKGYAFYLHKVALLPYAPEQILGMAQQDLQRVVALQVIEHQRDISAPQLKIASTSAEEIARMAQADAEIRQYLVAHQILSVPADLPHWTMRAAPGYVAAFRGFGEMDDFTGPSRLQQDGTRWILPPSDDLPFFFRAYALDPRTTGIHEGVPGHFFQLSLARRNPDPIRRQYYDSTSNEGLGFYTEELMLQAGLYDDSPRTREIMFEFARLRALRVEADVKLSTGQFTIAQAADYLARTVPMDRRTAEEDAANYATTPGLGITYEVGKLQIESLLSDRRLQLGPAFNLREFDDYLWTNGNVPFSLLRWELLGIDESKQLNALPR